MQTKHHASILGAIHFSTLHVFAVTWLCVFEFLESSSDLTHWSALTTFHSSARTFVYRDAAPRLAPRFYRVKSE
jgi:hypothetical protein